MVESNTLWTMIRYLDMYPVGIIVQGGRMKERRCTRPRSAYTHDMDTLARNAGPSRILPFETSRGLLCTYIHSSGHSNTSDI